MLGRESMVDASPCRRLHLGDPEVVEVTVTTVYIVWGIA